MEVKFTSRNSIKFRNRKKINKGWMPPHTTLFFKKKLLKTVGLYDENFKISSDYDFMIRLFKTKK